MVVCFLDLIYLNIWSATWWWYHDDFFRNWHRNCMEKRTSL